MKKIAAIVVTAFLATPAMASVGAAKFSTDSKCNTWSNGKYTLQPSTTRNTDGSKRR